MSAWDFFQLKSPNFLFTGVCLKLYFRLPGMWGFHDRLLTLRKALHAFLTTNECAASIYRRWRWQSHLQNLQVILRY